MGNKGKAKNKNKIKIRILRYLSFSLFCIIIAAFLFTTIIIASSVTQKGGIFPQKLNMTLSHIEVKEVKEVLGRNRKLILQYPSPINDWLNPNAEPFTPLIPHILPNSNNKNVINCVNENIVDITTHSASPIPHNLCTPDLSPLSDKFSSDHMVNQTMEDCINCSIIPSEESPTGLVNIAMSNTPLAQYFDTAILNSFNSHMCITPHSPLRNYGSVTPYITDINEGPSAIVNDFKDILNSSDTRKFRDVNFKSFGGDIRG